MANFDWAVNPQKLAQAELALKNAQKLNPAVVIDEDSIKAEYVKRGGLLLAEASPRVKEAVKAKRGKK